jgi:hypothetical protein
MPPFQSPQTMIREDLVRIVLAGLIAALPSETLPIVTNPKPRDWPVSRSIISLTSETD